MIMIRKQEAPTLVIDGDNLLHRAYWISKDRFINSKGENTGVTYSGIRMIKNYVDQFGAKDIYVAWDKKSVKIPVTNYRKEILASYKGNRLTVETKNDADLVHEQSDRFTEVLTALGIKHIYPRVLEADDVISWLSKNINGRVVIVSNDGDLLQLVNENVAVFNPIKKITVDHLNFETLLEVPQQDYLYYRAVHGDDSDCIPGLKGYGPKKARKLAHDKEARQKLTQEQQDIITRNLKLMDLSKSLDLEPEEEPTYKEQFNQTQNIKSDMKQFYKYCQDLEFRTILNHFNEYLLAFGK